MTSALNKYSNLTQRIIAAIIAAPLMLFAIWYSDWSYFAIFFIICLFSILEFYKLLGLDGMAPLRLWGTMSAMAIYTLIFLVEKDLVPHNSYFISFPLLSCIFFIKLYKKSDLKPFTNIAFTFLGIIYVGLPFSLLHLASFANGQYSYQIIMGCLFLLWASDTGAYFAGTRFGKRKLFERISPKKSWEGFVGGAITSLAVSVVLSYYFHDLVLWKWMSISAIIVVAGTYGDLVESLFKRSIAIKDSGSSIPGHGGFLDRFDGLLLSIPFIVTFLYLFQ